MTPRDLGPSGVFAFRVTALGKRWEVHRIFSASGQYMTAFRVIPGGVRGGPDVEIGWAGTGSFTPEQVIEGIERMAGVRE